MVSESTISTAAGDNSAGNNFYKNSNPSRMSLHSSDILLPMMIWSPLFSLRGGNRAGRVGFGFRLDGSSQFDYLEEIGLGRVGSGSGRTGSGRVNLYVVFFQIVDRFRLD
jgi:hypothetical protein